MLVSAFVQLARLRLALARFSVIAAAVLLLVCGFLTNASENNIPRGAGPTIGASDLAEDLPTLPEQEDETEKDGEIEADSHPLLFTGFSHEENARPTPRTTANRSAFLPLRSREVERELFRPPQEQLAARRS